MPRTPNEKTRRAGAAVIGAPAGSCLAAMAAGLLLAACVAGPADRPADDAATAIEDDTTAADGLQTDLPPRSPDLPAEPPPPPPPPEPSELVGLAAHEVTLRLGAPGHVWREPPAHVWRYTVDGCVLHVFLYPGASDLTVSHIEVRPIEGGATPPDTEFSAARCYGAVRAAGGG